MDVPKNYVAKRTRYQRQKAEEELLEKAKNLKDEKNRKKNGVGGSSEKPVLKRSSKDESDEASSSDIDILGEKYIPPELRRQLPKSRITKLHESIVIEEIPAPSPGYDSMGANKNQGIYKNIGAPSGSISVSTSSKDDLGNSKGDGVFFLGEESNDHCCKDDENHNQGREIENGYGSHFSWESSSEEDGGGGDESDSESDASMSTSEPSSEEDDDDSDDDYNGDESENSETESDESCGYYKKGSLKGGTDKNDGITSSVKRNPVGQKVDCCNEDEGGVSNRTLTNESDDECRSTLKDMDMVRKKRKAGNVHEENGKKGLVLGLDMWVDGTKKEDTKSQAEELPPPGQVSESRKMKLDSGKPSSKSNLLSDKVAKEPDDANHGDNFAQKSIRKSNIGKQSKRKNRRSIDIDIMNILSDSIWEEGDDALMEKLPPLEEKAHIDYSLPLKFRFEDDQDSTPLEKDEEQKEVDNLFADLEMGWTQEDIGSTKLSKVDNNDTAVVKMTDPGESCRLGHHFLILDEKIGLICKYCGIVKQEIKHVLPDLKIPSRRRIEWFDFHNDDSSLSYEFHFEDSSASGDHHALIDTDGPVLNIIPAYLRRQMYPHQLDGFQFLWKNIAGTTMIDDLKTSLSKCGTGCIISHAPGTGKSFLTIVFLLTFMEVDPTCRPVIIAPLTMLRAWADELKRWKVDIPFHNLNDAELSGGENAMAASIIQQMGSRRDGKQDRDYKRMVKLYSWTKKKSILGIGYNLFEKLAGENGKGNYAEKFRKILLELPGVLILDEGHTPRNQNTRLWKALTKIETGRRIILSGTPFQNNFDELYNTFCLVNPKFAECISVETCKSDTKKKNNPGKGRWASLTSLIGNNADDAVKELRAMMDPFVHVHKGNILQERLPGLRDTLIVLNPSDLQKQLLPKIPNNILEKVHLVSLVSVHPFLIAQHEEFSDHKSILEELEMNPEAGVKTQFVLEIVRLSNARDEKVLIFSEFIDPLNFLMKQLTSYFSWEEGRQVLYMDGKLEDKQRQMVISNLNAQESEAKVLLASTKACSEGISLVGASRVVLLDVVWNPSVERQAISRAYRLGQKKFVYVYHLILSGTMEIEKYRRQAKKDRISELVFSSPYEHCDKSKTRLSGSVLEDDILDAMIHHKNLCHIFEEILPQAKEASVFENF